MVRRLAASILLSWAATGTQAAAAKETSGEWKTFPQRDMAFQGDMEQVVGADATDIEKLKTIAVEKGYTAFTLGNFPFAAMKCFDHALEERELGPCKGTDKCTIHVRVGPTSNLSCAAMEMELARAAWDGKSEKVMSLLHRGARVDLGRYNGGSALNNAARNGHCRLVSALLEKGADVESRGPWPWSDTPLMQAAYWGHADCARLLLAHGADIQAKCGPGSGDRPPSSTSLRLALHKKQNEWHEVVAAIRGKAKLGPWKAYRQRDLAFQGDVEQIFGPDAQNINKLKAIAEEKGYTAFTVGNFPFAAMKCFDHELAERTLGPCQGTDKCTIYIHVGASAIADCMKESQHARWARILRLLRILPFLSLFCIPVMCLLLAMCVGVAIGMRSARNGNARDLRPPLLQGHTTELNVVNPTVGTVIT